MPELTPVAIMSGKMLARRIYGSSHVKMIYKVFHLFYFRDFFPCIFPFLFFLPFSSSLVLAGHSPNSLLQPSLPPNPHLTHAHTHIHKNAFIHTHMNTDTLVFVHTYSQSSLPSTDIHSYLLSSLFFSSEHRHHSVHSPRAGDSGHL